jgi:hypothetical protein
MHVFLSRALEPPSDEMLADATLLECRVNGTKIQVPVLGPWDVIGSGIPVVLEVRICILEDGAFCRINGTVLY